MEKNAIINEKQGNYEKAHATAQKIINAIPSIKHFAHERVITARTTNARAGKAENSSISNMAGKSLVKKPTLTQQQLETAKQVYYEAYKLMAYKTKKRYSLARALFKKVKEIAPDPDFEFYGKANKKILYLEQELKKF